MNVGDADKNAIHIIKNIAIYCDTLLFFLITDTK